MANVVQANHGFTVLNEAGKSVFIYQQEKYSVKTLLPLMFTLSILALILLLFIQPGSFGAGLFFWLLLTFGGFFLIKYLMNLNRKEKRFSLDVEGFEVDNNKYSKENITSLFAQEGNSAPIADLNMNHSSGSFIAFKANPAGLMAASATNAVHGVGKMADAAGDKFRKNKAKLNCKVLIRYGNKNIPLATGITIDTAEVMLKKIVDISQSN